MGKQKVYKINSNIINQMTKAGWRVGDCTVCGKKGIRSSKWEIHRHLGDIPIPPIRYADSNLKAIEEAAQVVKAALYLQGLKFLQERFPEGISAVNSAAFVRNMLSATLQECINDPRLPINHPESTENDQVSNYAEDSLLGEEE